MKNQDSPTARPAGSVGSKIARGAAWMVVLQSADRMLGFISMLVLARLLFPADFGLVALGMALVGSLTAFSEFGFDLALIQNQKAERRHYDTAWTLSFLRGVLLAGLLLAIAEPGAALLGDERLVELVCVLSLVPFLEGFINIGTVEFRKQLVFRKEFLFRFSSRIGGVLTTVALAFLWRDYWALVVGQITASCLRLLLSYLLQGYRPRPSLAAWKELFHFSKWLFLNGLAQFASRRASTFVVGIFLNPAAVGLFALSGEIMNTITQALIAPVQRTFFPGLAKISEDTAAMRDVLMMAYSMTVMLSVPMTVGLGLTAEFFVPLAFGDKWLETIPVIQILVVSALATSLQAPVRPLLLAINRPELVTILSVVNAAVLLPVLVFGTWKAGIEGAAWALAVRGVVLLIIQHYLLRRFLQTSFSHVLSRLWRTLAASAVMVVAVWFVKDALNLPEAPGISDEIYALSIVVPAGALAFAASLLALWAACGRPADSAESVALAACRKKLLRPRARPQAAVSAGEKTGR